jgi:hypothetical protein
VYIFLPEFIDHRPFSRRTAYRCDIQRDYVVQRSIPKAAFWRPANCTSRIIKAVPYDAKLFFTFPSEFCGFENPSSCNIVGIRPRNNLFNAAVARGTDPVASKGTLLDAG